MLKSVASLVCSQGQEYADQYLLEYQREEDGPWIRFHNRKAQEVSEALYAVHIDTNGNRHVAVVLLPGRVVIKV